MREDYDNEFWEKHSVSRPAFPVTLVEEFEALIDTCPGEREVQRFLEKNPWILAEQFPHCHFVLPQFRLADQYVTDFVAPERCSGETIWMLVEIERPKAKLVTKDGDFAKTVRTAIGQVRDWKRWLLENQELARKSRLRGGLGLHDMSRLLTGYVVVGRRSDVTERFNQLRSDLLSHENITIVTYDRLIEWARQRAEFWENYHPFPS